jgi:hypothetical protein
MRLKENPSSSREGKRDSEIKVEVGYSTHRFSPDLVLTV